MKIFLSILFFSLFCGATVVAQTVSNVSVSQEGKMIVVSYDIDKASSIVQLTVSTDGGNTFSSPLKKVSGDVADVKPGHRRIIWDVLSEMESFCGDNIVFDVVVGRNWVDLGLSVKWATCNIGALAPEEFGLFFAWGDVKGQTWNGSSWSKGGFFKTHPASRGNEHDDDYYQRCLEPKYDAAHIILGGKWRMPTFREMQELIDNCAWEWISFNGVKGYKVTSNVPGHTGKSIFLPAAGEGLGKELTDRAHHLGCTYWTSYGCPFSKEAYCLSNREIHSFMPCQVGLPIRPVLE